MDVLKEINRVKKSLLEKMNTHVYILQLSKLLVSLC